jgi:hypothetical protein
MWLRTTRTKKPAQRVGTSKKEKARMMEPIQTEVMTAVKQPRVKTQPPQDSSECLSLLSIETVKTSPSARRLRLLRSLLRNFAAQENAQRQDAKNQLLAEQNRLAAEKLALSKAEYLRRMSLGPLGARTMIRQIELLKEKVRTLELELAGVAPSEVQTIGCEEVA